MDRRSGAELPEVTHTVYKYLKAEHATSFIERGEILIGTLSDFRRIEAHDAARGDAGEGSRTLTQHVNDAGVDEIRASKVASHFIGFEGECNNVRVTGMTFVLELEAEDLYIYCVSEEASKRSLREFNADICVRITKPLYFFSALTSCLAAQQLIVGNCDLGRCKYGSRRMEYRPDDQTNSAFLKPPDLGYQKEIRGVWTPRARPIEPVLITCAELRKYLTIQPIKSAAIAH